MEEGAGVLRFADCELDAARFELRRAGSVVPVEPQVMDLIVHLVRNPGRLVTKDELIAAVWGGRIVSDAALASRIKSARRALGDDGSRQALIKTVHGRGVRFVGEVAAPRSSAAPATVPDAAAASVGGDIPSVAVLRFQVLSDDPAHAATARGITEDLTTHLARVPGFFVIARYSTLGYDPATVDPRGAARELGVRYLVEGSLRPVESGLRIHARLVDAVAGGVQLWAGQFDTTPDVPFAVDAITLAIAGKLGAELTLAQVRLEKSRPAADSGAWPPMRRALAALIVHGWSEESFAEAERQCRAAIQIDPEFALAHSVLALTVGLGQRFALIRRAEAGSEAMAAAERALALAPGDSEVLSFAGCAIADLGLADRAIMILERAIEADPSNAHGWVALGSSLLIKGDVEAGIEKLRHGIRVSPRDARLAIWQCFLGCGLLAAGRHAAALAEAERACARDERFYPAHVIRAVALLRLERRAEADAALRAALRIRPALSLDDTEPWVGRQFAEELREVRETG